MKQVSLCLMALCLSLTFYPLQSNGATNTPITLTDSTDAKNIVVRLNEIKEMDKSNLNSSEKKALRKEVKSLEKELKKSSSGVYLSIGAIIIIILLLILLV